MKKVFKFFAAALVIVAAASCAKELSDNNTTQTPDQELVHKVFSASLNVDSDTKTTLHTDGVSVHWTEDDKIKVLPVNSASGTDFSVVSCDGVFADFEGETIDASLYRAVYPAAALLSDGYINSLLYTEHDYYILASGISKCALAHQYAVENNFSIVEEFGSSSNFAISTHYSEAGNLYFKNVNAYLKVRLAMDNAASIEVSAAKVMKQPDHYDGGSQSLSDMAKLGGPIAIDYKYKNKIGIVADAGEDITFKKEDGSNLLSGDDIYYYIAIPAVKIEGLKLVVKDANGKVLQTMTKKSTFTAESNKIYNLGVLEEAKVEPAKVGDYFYSDGTYSTALDNSNSKTVVGVVFYVGDPTADDATLKKDYPNCTNGLVVGLSEKSNSYIGTKKVSWEVPGFMTTIGAKYSGGVKRVDPVASLKTGYNNTKAFESVDYEGPALIYCREMPGVADGSAWFMPTIAECDAIRSELSTINTSLQNLNATVLSLSYATLSAEDATYIATYSITDGSLGEITKNGGTSKVRPIFAF